MGPASPNRYVMMPGSGPRRSSKGERQQTLVFVVGKSSTHEKIRVGWFLRKNGIQPAFVEALTIKTIIFIQ